MKRETILLLGLLLAILSSCMKNELDAITQKGTIAPETQLIELLSGVVVEKRGNEYIWEGDIILSPDQIEYLNQPSTRSAAIKLPKQYWPSAKVYYTFEQNFPDYAAVNAAIAHYHANTSIEFIPRTTEKNYIIFRTTTNTNSSSLGMVGGGQSVNIAAGQPSGVVIHELGHALGLYHEQCRSDRDQYITIHWNNIVSGKEHNFRTYIERGEAGMDLGEFDFNSIMLYDPKAFAKESGLRTITKKDNSTYPVNDTALSTGDKQMIRAIYGPPYMRLVNERTYYDSWYAGSTDYYYEEGNTSVEFYADKTMRQKTVLNVPRYLFYSYIRARKDYGRPEESFKNTLSILLNGNGQESIYIGTYERENLWEQGNDARWYNNYYQIGW